MPRNTREWAHRELDNANNNLDWTATHLKRVFDVYNPTHPEIGKPIESIIDLLKVAHDAIVQLGSLF